MGTSIHALPQVPVSVIPLPQVPRSTAALPTVPASVLPIPEAPITTLALPQSGVTVLPEGFVPYVPPKITVDASSEGTSSAVVAGGYTLTAEASSTGSSTVDILPTQYTETSTGSEGTSSVEVTTAEVVEVVASSEGTSSVDTAVILQIDASGEGSSSVDTAVRIDAAASSAGNSAADVTLVGVLFPNASSEGTSSVDVRTFQPSGMVLGTESLTRFGTSYAQVPGTWVADSAYPGSSTSGNDLVNQSAGTGLTIQAGIYCHNNSGVGPVAVWLQIKVNGSIVATSTSSTSISAGSRGPVTLQIAGLTLAAGDLVRIEVRADLTNRGDAEINAATYVRVIKP